MRKRLSMILTLLCAALSMAGTAGAAWQLTARVNNPGGSLTVRGGASTRTFFKIYTTSQNVPVVITANPGYSISHVAVNGSVITPAPASPATYQMGLAAYPAKKLQAVSVYFVRQTSAVTATAGVGGTVGPIGTYKYPVGATRSCYFYPSLGKRVIDITGLPAGAVLTYKADGTPAVLPADLNKAVKVTYTVPAQAVTMNGIFSAVLAGAGAPQTIMTGSQATLNASATVNDGSAVTSYAWTQTAGPGFPTTKVIPDATAGQSRTISPTTLGTYVFKVVVTTDSGATATAFTAVRVVTSAVSAERTQCMVCHKQSGVGAQANVFSNWSGSAHKDNLVLCAKCHVGADSGAHPGVAFDQIPNLCISCHSGVAATSGQYQNWSRSSHNFANNNFEQVGCNSCHNQHSTVATATDDLTDSCSKCHKYYGPTANYSIYSSNGVMRTPHGQGVPAYMGGSGGASDNASVGWPAAQTSYLTRGAICTDCHGHDNTVNKGFAEGGHGKVSNDPMNAFNHYDWSKQTNNGTRQNGNCDRCHTAYGFMKFANMTTGYKRLRDGIAKQGTYNATIANFQANNVLICIGCHKSAEGELRTDAVPPGNGGPLSGGYFALFSSASTGITAGNTKIQVAFPGYKNSSICIPCHSGRSTDKVFIETIARAKADLKNYTTIQTSYYQHAANMAQTFTGQGAYDFSGALAAIGAGTHASVKMGVNDSQGPCVGCHYSKSDKAHSLEVNISDATCSAASCHATGFSAASLAVEEENFNAAVKALDEVIRAKFDPLRVDQTKDLGTERVNVRFGRFNKAPGQSADDITARNAYGAWYNWQLLTVWDKAAFVHNTNYARKIVADTIDYLDDGSVNGTTAAAISATTTLTAAEKTAAADFTNGIATTKVMNRHVDPSSATYKVQYLPPNSAISCGTCHNAAGETTAQAEARKAWADSGHGETTALPWLPASSHLWRSSGSTVNFQSNIPASDCVRCHTPEGFAQFANSGFSNVNPVASAADAATGSPLTCNACHTNGLNATTDRLAVPQVTTFYNISSAGVKGRVAASFPNVGESNMCIPCHAGRVSGPALVAAAPQINFTNSGFQNSHYMAAAGLMYAKVGFAAFTTATTVISGSNTYGNTMTATDDGGLLSSTHRKLGTTAIRGDSHNPAYFVAGNLDTNGPCVTCHLKGYETTQTVRPGAGHSLKIGVETWNNVCNNCHSAETGWAANGQPLLVEEEAVPYNSALAILKDLVQSKLGCEYDSSAYPYFYKAGFAHTTANALKNWTAFTAGLATPLKNEGAAFNLNLLTREPYAYVHARTYTRRLIYDSIDYLDDGLMNRSVSTYMTATLGLTKPADASGTTDNDNLFKYLLSYDRTTKAWKTPERP